MGDCYAPVISLIYSILLRLSVVSIFVSVKYDLYLLFLVDFLLQWRVKLARVEAERRRREECDNEGVMR